MSTTQRLAYGAATLAMGASLLAVALPAQAAALTSSQISAITALLSSFGANASVIANVTVALNGGTPSTSTGGQGQGGSGGNGSGMPPSPPMWMGSSSPLMLCPPLKHDFMMGSSDGSNGGEVSELQQYLKTSGTYTGPVTGYFGKLTQAGLQSWETMAASATSTPGTMPSTNVSPRAVFAHFCMPPHAMGMMGSSTPGMMPPPPMTGSTTPH